MRGLFSPKVVLGRTSLLCRAPVVLTCRFTSSAAPRPAVAELAPKAVLSHALKSSKTDPFSVVAADLEIVRCNIRSRIGNENPLLESAADHLFQIGGKGLRPALVLLIGKALSSNQTIITTQHGLAEVTEMIHTASLIHDDILDGSSTRRGQATVGSLFGNKVAILVGDYLLARASAALARLGSLECVILISNAIEHLVEGELMQTGKGFGAPVYQGVGVALNSSATIRTNLYVPYVDDCTPHMRHYLIKNYFKTASLFAHSCRSSAVLGGCPEHDCQTAFSFGKNLGMAFQIVDDVLDFVGDAEAMGKPAFGDIRNGHVTAPVLYAAQRYPEIIPMVKNRLPNASDFDMVLRMIEDTNAIDQARGLAQAYGIAALDTLQTMAPLDAQQALVNLVFKVLDRKS